MYRKRPMPVAERLQAALRDRRVAVVAVGVAAALVYVNSLGNRFAYDDRLIVVENTAIHGLTTLPGAILAPYWPVAHGVELGLWRPVTTAVLGLTHVIGGGAPIVFHAVNVIAHVGASLLLLLLLLELMSAGAALVGALVFAVHPVHVEAVANVVGVAEVVSTVAVLAACLVHVRSGSRSGWRIALGLGALYAVGFGAKESAVTLPGLLFLLDAARGRLGFGDLRAYLAARWRLYAVLAGVAAALLAARWGVLGTIASALPPLGAHLLTEIPRIWTLGEIWMHYVRLWVFPLDLSSDYSPAVIPVSSGWGLENAVGTALVVLLLGLSLHAWRRPALSRGTDTARTAAFGAVWFLIAISPISNTLFLSGVLLAERTLYLPSAGLAAATGWLVVRIARDRPRAAAVGLVAVLLAGGVRTWTRNPTWYDNSTVLRTLLRDYPHAGRSQWILGDVFLATGREREALRAYRAAIGLLGVDYQVATEIARQLMDHEHYRAAEVLLGFAVEQEPRYPLAHGLLALIRAEHGDAAATEAYSRASLAREQRDPTRHHLLAWALAAQGRLDEAARARAHAVEQAEAGFWQRYMYQAYQARASEDDSVFQAALDSAWSRASTDIGLRAIDSVIVSEFRLPSRVSPAGSEASRPPGA
jgi:protein O-mannosyl-transferase